MSFEDDLKNIMKLKGKADIRYVRYILHSLQWTDAQYSSALYHSARNLAKKILIHEINGSSIEEICKSIISLFKKLEIGKLKVESIEKEKIIFRLENSVAASKMTPINDKICFFEAGLIAGILEAKLKKDIKVYETMCSGLGDQFEEFTVNL
ncbi:MAG: DUF2507 domain-containing protein [Candidatus Aenigmarchaeota archaeon]|nr:DUF2507 domain-containing protein [Candidatus Aenigmarchaeota archaeon]